MVRQRAERSLIEAMNALLTHVWTRAVRDFRLAGRRMRRPPGDEDLR